MIPVADLQWTILAIAITVGAIRGGIGYFLLAVPEEEEFNIKKFVKTLARYAIVNVVTINALALTGVEWTIISVVIYTIIQLSVDIGFDLNNTAKTPIATPVST